jgi:GGDEF domain-containing protein
MIDRISPEGVLLQLQEIVRRKAVDPRRANMVDQFSHVPVSIGIAMADRLASDQHINFSSFWLKTNQHRYHIFTGYERLAAFKRLGAKYIAVYLPDTTAPQRIAHMKELMMTFYGPLPISDDHINLHEFIELFEALNHD